MEVEGSGVKKEKLYRPVYIRFGRGEHTQGITLDPKMVEVITEALRSQTHKGDMATAGLHERTPEGRRQANTIFEIVELLKEKAD